jgi:cytochrome P450
VALLLAHPDQLALLRSNRALANGAAEEVLRFEPLIPVMAREPLEDLEVAGVTLAAGKPYLLSILSANRDASVFEDPDRLDITRDGPRSFSFGWGSHFCLGSSLARAEFQEVIPEFFDCCRDVELLIDEPQWVPFANLRRIEKLPIRFKHG